MSKDNSKRLYDHYIEIGYNKAAEDMLAKYPEFNDGKKKTTKKTTRVESDEGQAGEADTEVSD